MVANGKQKVAYFYDSDFQTFYFGQVCGDASLWQDALLGQWLHCDVKELQLPLLQRLTQVAHKQGSFPSLCCTPAEPPNEAPAPDHGTPPDPRLWPAQEDGRLCGCLSAPPCREMLNRLVYLCA
jgi:hypothetical protein